MDRRKVKLYLNALISTAARQDVGELQDLWMELKQLSSECIVVWDALKREHRTEFAWINDNVRSYGSTSTDRH